MLWQIPVVSRVLTAHILAPYVFKKIVGLPGRTRRLVWQFGLAFVFSIVLAVVTKSPFTFIALLALGGVGVVNSIGAYCQWRAIDISQAKSSLFTQGDDLIALALGYWLLNETKLLNPMLAFGVTVAMVSAITFSWVAYKRRHENGSPVSWRNLALWIAAYSIIWGVAVFLMRHFALDGVSLSTFMVGWYGGSLIGALILLIVLGKKEAGTKLAWCGFSGIPGIALLTLAIWGSNLFNYAALQLAPLTVIVPIFQVTEMVFPTLIGLYVRNHKGEREVTTLRFAEKVIFGSALVGAIVIFVAL